MLLYSTVPVRGSAQCALHTKSLLKVLKSGKACLKVICVYKKMGFQVLFERAQCRTWSDNMFHNVGPAFTESHKACSWLYYIQRQTAVTAYLWRGKLLLYISLHGSDISERWERQSWQYKPFSLFRFNPWGTELFNLNLQSLEVVSRYRDPQL